ncbi:MAG: hypothetical protein Q9203_003805 [Teloschistes exilis]
MGKDQAGLELGSPRKSSNYGRQDEYPTAYNQEAPEYYERKRERSVVRRDCRSQTAFALGLALILCCAGAVVATYFAIQFRNQARYCQPPNEISKLNTSTSSSQLVATSSCSQSKPTYTSDVNSTTFSTHCHTWFQGHNLLGVYVYTFEACMDACASFNSYGYMHNASRCHSVTYDAAKEDAGRGNCWLKALPNIAATSKDATDSAALQ